MCSGAFPGGDTAVHFRFSLACPCAGFKRGKQVEEVNKLYFFHGVVASRRL